MIVTTRILDMADGKIKEKRIEQRRKMTEVNEKVTGSTGRGCSHQEETMKTLGPG